MAKKSFSVRIPTGICGNSKGVIIFDEDGWPDDTSANLKVNSPMRKCDLSQFEVVSETKRFKRIWTIRLKPTNHYNHLYPVSVVNYQKTKNI